MRGWKFLDKCGTTPFYVGNCCCELFALALFCIWAFCLGTICHVYYMYLLALNWHGTVIYKHLNGFGLSSCIYITLSLSLSLSLSLTLSLQIQKLLLWVCFRRVLDSKYEGNFTFISFFSPENCICESSDGEEGSELDR